MSEDTQTGEVNADVGQEKSTDQEVQKPELTNAEAKKLPWVRNALKAESRLKELEEKIAKEQKEREFNKAKESEDFEKALGLQRAELERELTDMKDKLLMSDLKATLLEMGAKTPQGFLKAAVAEYDAEQFPELKDFGAHLQSSEDYKAFFTSAQSESQPKPKPTGALPVTGDAPSWDQVRQWELSDNREDRIKARKLIREHKAKTGKYPYEINRSNK